MVATRPAHAVPLPSFVRAIALGLVATGADLAVLALLVEGAHLAPSTANVPALLAGLVVQFLGCRAFVFPETARSLGEQARGFLVAEAGTLALNGISFHVLVSATQIPYAAARTLGQLAVFVLISYPAWRRVFGATRARGVTRRSGPDL